MEDGAKGHANEAIGKAKTGFGEMIGDDKLAAEGDVQQAEGTLQKIIGDVKEKASEAAEAIQKQFKKED